MDPNYGNYRAMEVDYNALEKFSVKNNKALTVAGKVLSVLSLEQNLEAFGKNASNINQIREWLERDDLTNMDKIELAGAALMTAVAGGLKMVEIGLDVVAVFGIETGALPVGWAGFFFALAANGVSSFYSWQLENEMNRLKEKYGGGGSYSIPPIEVEAEIDPSGYVYEAVLSNRVDGAEAVVWQKETKYDMYDEPYEEISQWDSMPYNQVNPQMTNKDGEFAWDVPEGVWQIRVTKAGYEDAETEWMEVPPERTDVHIPLVSAKKPYVDDLTMTKDGIKVVFEKYVVASQLDGAFSLTADGSAVPVSVSAVNAEQSPEGVLLASQALVKPLESLDGASIVTLRVSGALQSYAGVSVGEDMDYGVDTIPCELEIAPAETVLLVGGAAELQVAVTPEGALSGKPLSVSADSSVVSVENPGALDDSGRATVRVTALADGETVIRFSAAAVEAEARVVCVDPEVHSTLWLPAALTQIDSEAFEGSGAEIVVIPAGCVAIDSLAFAGCENLKYVILPAGAEIDIAEDAFQGSAPVMLYN